MKITVNERKQSQFVEVTLGDDYVVDAMVGDDTDLPTVLRQLAREIDAHLDVKANKPGAAA